MRFQPGEGPNSVLLCDCDIVTTECEINGSSAALAQTAHHATGALGLVIPAPAATQLRGRGTTKSNFHIF